jgi:hypothetical protein
MQDNQIGPKIVGLAPADTARLPPSIIPKKYIFSSKQPRLPAGTTPSLNLPCFTRDIVLFINTLSFKFLDFYGLLLETTNWDAAGIKRRRELADGERINRMALTGKAASDRFQEKPLIVNLYSGPSKIDPFLVWIYTVWHPCLRLHRKVGRVWWNNIRPRNFVTLEKLQVINCAVAWLIVFWSRQKFAENELRKRPTKMYS